MVTLADLLPQLGWSWLSTTARAAADTASREVGTPVRNVAYQVLRAAYRFYTLRPSDTDRTGWQVDDARTKHR